MKRWLRLGIAALGLAGCQMNRNPSDPFMRTTVPPPATGQIAPAAGDYYTPPPGSPIAPGAVGGPSTFMAPPPPAGAPLASPQTTPLSPPPAYNPPPPAYGQPPAYSQPPASTQPGSAPPAAPPSKYQPQGGFNFQQTSADPKGASDSQSASVPAATGSAANGGSVVQASNTAPAGASGTLATTDSATQPAVVGDSAPAGDTTAGSPANNASAGQTAQAGGAATIRIVDSQPAEVGATVASQAAEPVADSTVAGPPVRLTVGQPVKEITDLPQSASSDAPRMYGAPRSRLVFGRPTTGTATAGLGATSGGAVAHTVERPASDAKAASDAAVTYGVEGNYEKLHGRLEYSQSARQWKLRYIPIDGQTDQYGGSVVLSDSPTLHDLHAGDFVAASGRLTMADGVKRGFSPQFDAQQIIPQ